MITVNLHISEGPVSRYVSVRAGNLKRAMALAGSGRPDVKVEVVGPLRLVSDTALAFAPVAEDAAAA